MLSSSPGASRCPLLGRTSRGDIGERRSLVAPIRRIWRWWMVEEILPLLLDVRSVWAVKVGAAFYKFNQQISARFDVTF